MEKFTYEAMGTQWEITIWDEPQVRNKNGLPQPGVLEEHRDWILKNTREFEAVFSRFKKDSLVTKIASMMGTVEVPTDFTAMLQIYKKLFVISGGKVNPLIGNTLSDMGYDANYSLTEQSVVRATPSLDTVQILDDTHVEITSPGGVLFDFGALGKGFFVDKIAQYLMQKGLQRFLVNGSGDIYYHGNGEVINTGLEHPSDASKIIGVVPMVEGAMCASGTNRRRWGKYHHIIDPTLKNSPEELLAVWVMTDSAAVADGLATGLFFAEPEAFEKDFQFEYCIVNNEMRVKHSEGFKAEFF